MTVTIKPLRSESEIDEFSKAIHLTVHQSNLSTEDIKKVRDIADEALRKMQIAVHVFVPPNNNIPELTNSKPK